MRRATLTAALTATAPAFGTPAWLIRSLSGRAWTSTDARPAPLIRGLWVRVPRGLPSSNLLCARDPSRRGRVSRPGLLGHHAERLNRPHVSVLRPLMSDRAASTAAKCGVASAGSQPALTYRGRSRCPVLEERASSSTAPGCPATLTKPPAAYWRTCVVLLEIYTGAAGGGWRPTIRR
jgi:hypothetical protein